MTDIPRSVDISKFKRWTQEEIEAAFPSPEPSAQSKPHGSGAGTQGDATSADEIDEFDLTADLLEWIHDGVPESEDRSVVFFKVVKALKKLGYKVDAIFNLLDHYPTGIAQKYRDRKFSGSQKRLRKEVERAYNKKPRAYRSRSEANSTASSLVVNLLAPNLTATYLAAPNPGAPAPVPASAAVLSSPLSQPLIDAHGIFKKWLGEKYDTVVLDATASAGAAERLGGDPLWLMMISGSGNAKTETVQSLSGAGARVTSTIASEGALLAATARSHGATGGLLYKIGARGLLVIKDFTSILAMDSKVRGSVLAALREIHDGKWERNVGFAGGRTLTWVGRIVVVGACTTAWDEARKVVEAMGDRFVLARSDSMTGREESARKAIENTGKEDVMRAELAGVMGALVASADVSVHGLTEAESDRLIKLANVVTWARSGVERDFKGVVINAHAPEMPTRFAKQLAQMMRGAMSLGMPAEIAMQLATRCARDSLEPLRHDLLLDVAANPDTNPDDVHKRVIRPLTTVKNNLVALHTLRLLICEEREEWRGNRTFLIPYYSLAPELDRATLLNM